ncbi:MAG TPA: MMPL family transporter [Solirubrobacteraceae bacterium]|nr:MMPL family transporter [Solirubrobacteraceae bacterium]
MPVRLGRALTAITSRSIAAPRRTLVAAAIVVLAAAILAAPVTGALQPFSSDDPGSQSVAARRALERATGTDPYFNLVALVPAPRKLAADATRKEVADVEGAMRVDPVVAAVRSYYSDHSPAFVARDGRATLVVGVLRAVSTNSQLAGAHRVERRLAGLPGVRLGGLAAFYAQGNELARADLIRSELFAFPLLLLVALWVFRGVVAALLPLVVGAITIVGTLAALRVIAELSSVSIYALNIATALGLGLAVDYGLLIISRYREEIARIGPGPAALQRTLASAGRTVAFSSLTVAAVLSCLLVFPQAFLRSIGLGGIFVALIAGASALIVLPAILTLLRWRVNAGALTRWRSAAYAGAQPSPASAWSRIARLATRRPVWIVLVVGAILLGLASPVLGLRITQVDANVLPRSVGARAVSEALEADFPKVDHSPVLLAVQAPPTSASPARVRAYATRLGRLADVAAVQGPERVERGLWQIDVVPADTPLSAPSQRLVEHIRALPTSLRVLAGGESASLVDLKRSLAQHAPAALVLLVLFTATAVFVMTGSVVLPALALLMNALTIAAVLGTLVLVFQHGALEGLLGYTSSHALEPSTLVLILAVSFGLATDYCIFLLSRIKEERDRGAPEAEAVARGLERTGRIVTAAALLLCIALASLVTARHALVKEVGFGAGLAVALDATLVRALLLPALMRLLGAASWYAPPPLARISRALAPALTEQSAPGRWPQAPPAQGYSMSPGHARAASLGDALLATRYCDHEHPAVRACLAGLAERDGCGEQAALAVAAFEFVRDSVLYAFGPWGVSASETLACKEGTCTNKANLLVALLRAAGIPSAYGVMRVNARKYFGVIGPSFLTRYASPESVHIYCAAFLHGRWVKCDPSTDRELASRTARFCRETCLVQWDGEHDSLDFLDPRHVYADLGLFANLDESLARPPRAATPQRLALANHYLAFIRAQPAFSSDRELVHAYLAARRASGAMSGVRGWLRVPG